VGSIIKWPGKFVLFCRPIKLFLQNRSESCMTVQDKIFPFVLLLVLIFCTCKNSLLVAFYKLNTEAFVEAFCENKTRPQLNCNGQCKLAKMAKENQQKEAANTLANLQNEVFFFHQNNMLSIQRKAFFFLNACYNSLPGNLYCYTFLSRTDRPPQYLA